MKNNYIVVNIKENDKLYAYALKVDISDNLISKLKIKNIISANICETKKEAKDIVDFWNESYKNNGTYMFLEPQF